MILRVSIGLSGDCGAWRGGKRGRREVGTEVGSGGVCLAAMEGLSNRSEVQTRELLSEHDQ